MTSSPHSERFDVRAVREVMRHWPQSPEVSCLAEALGEIEYLEEQYAAAQREADIQLGEKLAAQMTLKAVCDVLNLPMVSLGNGWTEATPKILARIEEIVDEAERGFRERDGLKEQLESAQERADTLSAQVDVAYRERDELREQLEALQREADFALEDLAHGDPSAAMSRLRDVVSIPASRPEDDPPYPARFGSSLYDHDPATSNQDREPRP